jgi:hypothetical protein
MPTTEMQDWRVALADLEARHTAELAALRRQLARPRRRRRSLVPALCLALLLALSPLAVLADFAFLDLNSGSPHNDNIAAIKAAGITKGCNPPTNDNYCPNDLVTREEMASFLARLGGLGSNPPVANAANAVNAAQLGGQPAGAYARASQFQTNLVVSGTGPLPKTGNEFVTNGGMLIFFTSGMLYRANAGPLALRLRLDRVGGNNITVSEVGHGYTNEGASHKTLVTQPITIPDAPAGTYVITLSVGDANMLSNSGDYFSVMLLELPAP